MKRFSITLLTLTLLGVSYVRSQEPEGFWVMTNYFDSVLANKTIAKYRVLPATWFALVLYIENDTLKGFGSISGIPPTTLRVQTDTLCRFTGLMGDQWCLLRTSDSNVLGLEQLDEAGDRDTNTYTFARRPAMSYLLGNEQRFSAQYAGWQRRMQGFANALLDGIYVNSTNRSDTILIRSDKLSGLSGYDTFNVHSYFGTLHMYHNLDVIHLRDMDGHSSWQPYSWSFRKDLLTLVELVPETTVYKGAVIETDYWVPGDKEITLIKVD